MRGRGALRRGFGGNGNQACRREGMLGCCADHTVCSENKTVFPSSHRFPIDLSPMTALSNS